YVFDGSSGSGRNALFTGQAADPARWHLYSGSSPVTVGPPVGTGVVQVHTVTFDDGFNEHRINGEIASGGGAPLQALRGLILGARYTTDFHLDGAISEVLIYEGVLGEDDRSAIESYLLDKHPITDPDEPPVVVDVFAGGDGLYDTYRIPSILTTEAGTILAFAEGRANASDHARNDIVMRRSTDGGDTWSPVTVLHDAGGDSLNDPLVLQVRDGVHAGRVYLCYMSFPEGCHTNCVPLGYGAGTSRNWLMWSDDDGVTWTAPFDVTESFRRETTNFAGTPGVGFQKRHEPFQGRLVFPLRQGPAGSVKMYALFSDDGGDTWTRGDLVDDSQTVGGGDEVQMVELPDGSLLLNARSYAATNHRKMARSLDGGATWTPLTDTSLIEPQVMGSLVSLTEAGDGFDASRLLYAGPNSSSSRVDGSIWVSEDGGASWAFARSIFPGSYAYSVLTVIDPCEEIGCLFERDGYRFISLARIHPTWLLGERDGGCPCVADVNGDGALDIFDILAFLALLDGGDVGADWNGDTVLDIFDVLGFLEAFDAGC
ncbi:MAG: exo-alpha-sialidase, partial [Phycisphaerales bacterium]|nr:exo-alpha-sialidase [Phycisphaerales bacterium]